VKGVSRAIIHIDEEKSKSDEEKYKLLVEGKGFLEVMGTVGKLGEKFEKFAMVCVELNDGVMFQAW
jgi:hypothetical protein